MTDCLRLSLLENRIEQNEKQVVLKIGLEIATRRYLRETETSWEGARRESVNRSGWGMIVSSCISLGWLGDAVR